MKGKIIGIIICGLLAVGVLALLICNWAGAFAENVGYAEKLNNTPTTSPDEKLKDYTLSTMLQYTVPPIELRRYNYDMSHFQIVKSGSNQADISNIFASTMQFEIDTNKTLRISLLNQTGVLSNTYTISNEIGTVASETNENLGRLFTLNTGYQGWITPYNGYIKFATIEYNIPETLNNLYISYVLLNHTEVQTNGDYDMLVTVGLSDYVEQVKNVDKPNSGDPQSGYITVRMYRVIQENGGYTPIALFTNLTTYTNYQTNTLIKKFHVLNTTQTITNTDCLNRIVEYYNAYYSGFQKGYVQGWNEGIENVYSVGYEDGYNDGFVDGQVFGGQAPAINTGKALFRSVLQAFDVKIFGFMSILDIVSLIVVLGLVLFVIKLIRS